MSSGTAAVSIPSARAPRASTGAEAFAAIGGIG
jgi:hypothetical protein